MVSALSTSSRLLWKEWRELRWFLIVPLTLFLGLSLAEAYANIGRPYGGFRTDLPAGLTGGFGAMVAIFIAVAATTRDLRDELKVFWQSRPISTRTSLLIKFATGLAILLAVCVVPLLLQIELGRRSASGNTSSMPEGLVVLACHTPLLVLIYSVAFAIGCLIRQATHAAMISVAAATVLYFVPTLVPPLSNFSALHLMNDDAVQLGARPGWTFSLPPVGTVTVKEAYLPFAVSMVAGTGLMLLLAMWIVQRDWRVSADRRFVVWSLGGVILLVFCTLAFAAGANISATQSVDLPMKDQSIAAMAGDGERGVILMRDGDRVMQKRTRTVPVRLSTYTRTAGRVEFGPVIALTDEINLPNAFSNNCVFWRPEHPDRAYLLVQRSRYVSKARQVTATISDHYEIDAIELQTIDLSGSSTNAVIHRLDFLPILPVSNEAQAYLIGSTLYVAGADRFVVVDLTNPDAPVATVPPELIDTAAKRGPTQAIFWTGLSYSSNGSTERVDVSLPAIPELTPRQRLELRFGMSSPYHGYAYDGGDLLAIADKTRISTYRIQSIDEKTARFQLIGRRNFTPLERLVGRHTWKLAIHDGRLFAVEDGLGKTIGVYSIDAINPPRRNGHFALPRELDFSLSPGPGERLLVGGDRLYELTLPSAN